MSTAPATLFCPWCNEPLAADRQACPACHAPPDWIELGQAIDFALRRFEAWQKQGRLSAASFRNLTDYYVRQRQVCAEMAREGRPLPGNINLPSRRRCWSCRAAADPPPDYCLECGAPGDQPAVRSLRFLTFLTREIKKHGEAGRLTLAQVHDLLAEVRERLAAVRHRLEQDRLAVVVAVADAPSLQPAAPKRTLWEMLLDPRTIQWMLGIGGALFVLGLVIWLAAMGLFKIFQEPLTQAIALAAANLAVLAAGWAVLLRTRYQMAGRALTLLACLVMPLNLWFCDYNHLIQAAEPGNHLWALGLVCCVLYVASALVLRDHLFVYVLLGGVALTGLLLLADLHKFWEITAPSTMLVALGLAAIHLERAFPEGEGPFTRRRFGLAFFWSGQALLAAGLLLLLGAQLVGWAYEPIFRHVGLKAPPAITTELNLKLWAVALVAAGVWAYLYSDLVVRRVGVYVYFGVFALLWAEVLVLAILVPRTDEAGIIGVLAATALAALVLQATIARGLPAVARAMPPLGVFLSALPVLLGALLHFRATNQIYHDLWPYEISWGYVAAMLLTAGTCRVGAYLCRETVPWLSAAYFFGAGAALLAGAAALLSLAGLPYWDLQAVVLMAVPVAYLIASQLYRGGTAERPLVWVAHAATAFMIAGVITASLNITPQVIEPITGDRLNLLRALFCVEAALFYGLAVGLRKDGWSIYPAAAMACGAIWQLLSYWHTEPEYYTAIFAGLGFVLLVVYRLAVLERFEQAGLAGPAFQSANVLMSLAFLAAALLALTRMATDHVRLPLVGLLAGLAVLSLLAALLVRHPIWRPWYFVAAVGEALLAFVSLEVLIDLTIPQKVEIFAVAVGVLLLVIGHAAWYREQAPSVERQSEAVTLALLFGSLLTAVPLAVALLCYRWPRPDPPGAHFHAPDELGALAAGLVLLGSGITFRLKSTLLTGAALMALYVGTLLMFAHKLDERYLAGLFLAIGGAVVFGLGLVLSIYRDRLLTLPDKIKRREGVFRVLAWR